MVAELVAYIEWRTHIGGYTVSDLGANQRGGPKGIGLADQRTDREWRTKGLHTQGGGPGWRTQIGKLMGGPMTSGSGAKVAT